jgi:Mn2+/Fe2+ NRAMP family transporter
MKRFGVALLFAVVAYVAVAAASYLLVMELSSNRHDRELEAAMTSIFFYGPIGAVLAFIGGFVAFGRSGRPPRADG